jgi:hypothetical protein
MGSESEAEDIDSTVSHQLWRWLSTIAPTDSAASTPTSQTSRAGWRVSKQRQLNTSDSPFHGILSRWERKTGTGIVRAFSGTYYQVDDDDEFLNKIDKENAALGLPVTFDAVIEGTKLRATNVKVRF